MRMVTLTLKDVVYLFGSVVAIALLASHFNSSTLQLQVEQQIPPPDEQLQMDEKEIDQLDSEYGDAEDYEDNPDIFKIRLASHKLVI